MIKRYKSRTRRLTCILLALVGTVMAAISPEQMAAAIPSGFHAGITIFLLFMVPFIDAENMTTLDVFEAVGFQLIQLLGLSFGNNGHDYWKYASMPSYAMLFGLTYYLTE